MQEFRLRAAPSPTGRMHVGNLRTFIHNFLAVKHSNGKYILRIEDTDQARKVEGGVEAIIETLKLYGIEFDEGPGIGGNYGPYVQSERLDIYKKHAEQLVEQGDAYYCFCSKERLEQLRKDQEATGQKPGYDGHCRNLSEEEIQAHLDNGDSYVIRMKFPKEEYTEFRDEVYGTIRIDNKEFDDQILIKSDGYPTYHFAVVIDDHLMNITHVVRGREYLSQTPKNVFLYNALGWKIPKFIHVPPVLNPDGKGKLSKRHGALPAITYLRKGYLPEAMINFLALLGWAPRQADAKQDEIYTVDELIELFTLDRIRKANPRYDQRKLDYMNGKHLRRMSITELKERIFNWAENLVLGEFIMDKYSEHPDWETKLIEDVRHYLPLWKQDERYFLQALELVYERITTLGELPFLLNFFYDEHLDWTEDDWNTKNHDFGELADGLKAVLPRLEHAFDGGKDFDHDKWEEAVRGLADQMGWKHGDLFLAIRSAVTGRLQSPPLLDCFEVMGWEKVRRFIEEGIEWLEER